MSGKKKAEIHEEHVDESWLIPYADLLTLLLALFVSLYATASADQAKFDAVAEAFSQMIQDGGSMGWGPPGPGPGVIDEDPDGGDAQSEQHNLETVQSLVQAYLRENNLEGMVSTGIDDRGLVISVSDAVLFDPGSAEIKSEYRYVLVRIGEILNRISNYIRVEGHTDNIPQVSATFPSNWELSAGRAANVVRLLTYDANVSPRRLMAVAYGEYRPVADNNTLEGRGQNRRVDIIVMSGVYASLEDYQPQ